MSWFHATLETSVLIDAPPERVREVCLDFDRYPEWHTDFMKSTQLTRPSSGETVSGLNAEPGDTIAILSGGFVGHAVLLENGPTVFSYAYTGRKMGLDAVRTFRFTRDDSSVAGTRTRFTHFASWDGYAAVMFWSWSPVRVHVKGLFEGFHNDLKRATEEKSD